MKLEMKSENAGKIICFKTLKKYPIFVGGGGAATMPPKGNIFSHAAKISIKKIP